MSGTHIGNRHRVLVLGFYKSPPNLGDDLFKHAFRCLFPEIDFQFTDRITLDMLDDVSAVFIGGGSLLDGPPRIVAEALHKLKQIPLLYISVGAETNIHPTHQKLMSRAKLIAIRTPDHLAKVKEINPKTFVIPDLIYAMRNQAQHSTPQPQSILVFPNISVVPTWSDVHWKHLAFEVFKSETAQVLDQYIETGYTVDFYSFSQVNGQQDEWAAIEIINKMKHRSKPKCLSAHNNIAEATKLFSQYQIIITQRYHGAILAELAQVPYLCLYHHDKLRNTTYNLGTFLSYFEISKEKMIRELTFLQQKTISLPIEHHSYRDLVSLVNQCLNMSEPKIAAFK